MPSDPYRKPASQHREGPFPSWLFGPSAEGYDAFRHDPHGFSGPGVGRWVCDDLGRRMTGAEALQIQEVGHE